MPNTVTITFIAYFRIRGRSRLNEYAQYHIAEVNNANNFTQTQCIGDGQGRKVSTSGYIPSGQGSETVSSSDSNAEKKSAASEELRSRFQLLAEESKLTPGIAGVNGHGVPTKGNVLLPSETQNAPTVMPWLYPGSQVLQFLQCIFTARDFTR